MQQKGWSVMRIDEHHRHVTGLFNSNEFSLGNIMSFKDHTFSVVSNIIFYFWLFFTAGLLS